MTFGVGLGPSIRAAGLTRRAIGGPVQAIGRRPLSTTGISSGEIYSRLVPSSFRNCRIEHHPQCRLSLSCSTLGLSSRRHNSSSVPSKSSKLPEPAAKTPASPIASSSPSTSIWSRLTALTSLKGSQTTGETGYSSVAKLVELAKPEKKQLAMAVGLVRPLFARRAVGKLLMKIAGRVEWSVHVGASYNWEINRLLFDRSGE
jgi:hypothetical protein